MTIRIVIDHLTGSAEGKRQEFDAGSRVRFGRHPDSEVVFDAQKDLDVSTRHAELVEDGDTYWLVDVGSSNGTLVDAARIVRHRVSLGSPVEVELGAGGPRLRIFVGAVAAAPPPISTSSGVAPSSGAAKVERGRSATVFRSIVEQALDRSNRGIRLAALLLVGLSFVVGIVSFCLGGREARRAEAVMADRPLIGKTGQPIAVESYDAAIRIDVLTPPLLGPDGAAAGQGAEP
mgnify:CR=1 FL=1